MSIDNDDLTFAGGKTYTDEDMRKMEEICAAAHDQESGRLKAKFLELAELASEEKKYELLRYHRYNMFIEIILRVENEMGEDELITMAFDGNDWSNQHGNCSRETFEDILEAVDDLWNDIKGYVLQQDKDYGTVLTADADE